jgi:hypothetical protein
VLTSLVLPDGTVLPTIFTLFGACNENVFINGFTRLTLQGHPGATVTDASGGTAQTILVVDSTGVVFRTLVIEGGLVGVQCDSFSVCRFSGDTVENGGGGIQITGSRAELDGSVIRHTENGLTSLGASSIRIDGGLTMENNHTGIVVDGGSSLESIGATIRNNSLSGIEVSGASNLSLTTIQENGNGIEVVGHSNVHLIAGNTITGNNAFGIFLFDLSFASFDPGNNVNGNNLNRTAFDIGCFPQFSATRGALTNIGGGTTNCAEP